MGQFCQHYERFTMKQTINQSYFIDAFKWGSYKDKFSYHGLRLLFSWLEELEEQSEFESEFNVNGICSDFSEMGIAELLQTYNSLTTFASKYLGNDGDITGLSEDEQVSLIEDYLCSKTSFIGYTDNKTFIFANY